MQVFRICGYKSKSLIASISCINMSKNRQVCLFIDKRGTGGVGLYRGGTATRFSPLSIYHKPLAEWMLPRLLLDQKIPATIVFQ